MRDATALEVANSLGFPCLKFRFLVVLSVLIDSFIPLLSRPSRSDPAGRLLSHCGIRAPVSDVTPRCRSLHRSGWSMLREEAVEWVCAGGERRCSVPVSA